MNMEKLQAQFRVLGDADDARQLSRFFKTGPGDYGEGDIFLGIRVPAIRSFVSKNGDALQIDSIHALLRSKYHEERLLGLLMLVRWFENGAQEQRTHIYKIYMEHTHCVNNWDMVDLSAPKIVGAWLAERERDPLYRLAESDLLWDRRIAIVATQWFIRQNDFDDTLAISEKLLHDDHDLIHKATGWMLREVGKRDRAAEEKFLKKHYQKMPRTMLRYAIERFPEPLRLAYLKGNK